MIFCKRFFQSWCQTFLAGFLATLVWLGVFHDLAIAADIVPHDVRNPVVEGERLAAIVDCLPKELSQPSLGRALSEMGNDQLERAFNLKQNPQLSQAEVAFENCLASKGFSTPQDLREAIVED